MTQALPKKNSLPLILLVSVYSYTRKTTTKTKEKIGPSRLSEHKDMATRCYMNNIGQKRKINYSQRHNTSIDSLKKSTMYEFQNIHPSWVGWCKPIIPTLRCRQESQFQASLRSTRACLKMKIKHTKNPYMKHPTYYSCTVNLQVSTKEVVQLK